MVLESLIVCILCLNTFGHQPRWQNPSTKVTKVIQSDLIMVVMGDGQALHSISLHQLATNDCILEFCFVLNMELANQTHLPLPGHVDFGVPNQ